MSTRKAYLSSADFVIAVRDAKTVEEVAEKLGVDVQYVLRRTKELRSKNVDVPELSCSHTPSKRGRKPLDPNKLNGILESVSENSVESLIEKAVNDE